MRSGTDSLYPRCTRRRKVLRSHEVLLVCFRRCIVDGRRLLAGFLVSLILCFRKQQTQKSLDAVRFSKTTPSDKSLSRPERAHRFFCQNRTALTPVGPVGAERARLLEQGSREVGPPVGTPA